MTLKRCNTDILLQIMVAALVAIEFIGGIYESIYTHKYKQYGDGCNHIRTQILVFAVVDIVTAIVTLANLAISFNNSIPDNNMMTVVTGFEFAIALWAVISFHTMDDTCNNFWTTNAPELLTFVKIHYAVFWIFFGSFFFGLIGACVRDYFVAKKEQASKNNNATNLNHKTTTA